VDGDVDPAVEEGCLEGHDEGPLAPDRVRRPVVAGRADHDELDRCAQGPEVVGDHPGLGEREGAAAGSQAQRRAADRHHG
jgi:hypothetical protein